MTQSAEQRLAHICILVRDIDQAIEHYQNILSAVSPQLLNEQVRKQERFAGKDRYVTAFFPAPGAGCAFNCFSRWTRIPLYTSAWRSTGRGCTTLPSPPPASKTPSGS